MAGDVRIMWYSDGVEGRGHEGSPRSLQKDNPDIKVTLDNVAYNVVKEQLPVQLEAGSGPDIARVTDLKSLASHWLDLRPLLKDAAYWEDNFGDQFDWMRPDGSNMIPGFMTQLTLTGGFANKTLFEQAGRCIPGTEGELGRVGGGRRRRWRTASRFPARMAIDRSGHRITGPPISPMAPSYIGADGKPAPIDDGIKTFVTKLRRLDQGRHDVQGGLGLGGGFDLPRRDRRFHQRPGRALLFRNLADRRTSRPRSATASTGSRPARPAVRPTARRLPGGAGLVAIKYTKNPKDVAKVMEYLASAGHREGVLRAHAVPAGAQGRGQRAASTSRPTTRRPRRRSMSSLRHPARIPTSPRRLPGWFWSDTVYGALVTRVSQAMAGELSLDEAFQRIDADIAAGQGLAREAK